MGETSKESPKTTQKTPETLEDKKYNLKTAILELNANDKEDEYLDHRIKYLLDVANAELTDLEVKYPLDEDIKMLRLMYEDLHQDFEDKKQLNLDRSFDKIVANMAREIVVSGVHQESIHSGFISPTIAKLHACGIEPEYIVTKGNPKAPTVVLFLQAHPFPFEKNSADKALSRKLSEHSQDKIFEAIRNASNKGLIRDIYEEGLEYGYHFVGAKEAVKDDKNPWQNHGTVRALAAVKGIELHGMEDYALHQQTLKGVKELVKNNFLPNDATEATPLRHRLGAQNILLARNVSNAVNAREQELSFVVLGVNHEKLPMKGDPLQPNPHEGGGIAFAQALAYYDINVVVVETRNKST